MGAVALRVVDHLALLDDVGEAVGEPGGGRQAVAAGAARSPGSSPRRTSGRSRWATNRTSGLSMPMPNAIVATMIMPSSRRKRDWFARADARVEPGVVRQRRDALRGEELGGLLHRLAGEAVDDAGVAGVLGADQLEQLLRGSSFGAMRYWMLGRSKLATKCRARRSQARAGSAISAWVAAVAVAVSAMRGTSGQRSCSSRERQVVGPEVVAPLGDAVRLVDGEQRDRPAVEQPQRGRHPQPLRREVEQVELARRGTAASTSAPLVEVLGGVEEARRARRAPRSASTWSCISAISGEITTPTPGRTSAGIW